MHIEYKRIINIAILFVIFSCNSQGELSFYCPEIQTGNAKISGTVVFSSNDDQYPIEFVLKFHNPVTAKWSVYETTLDKNGKFSFDIPVECNSLGIINSRVYKGRIWLIPNKETKIKITFDKIKNKHIYIDNTLGWDIEDFTNLEEVNAEIMNAILNNDDDIETEIHQTRNISQKIFIETKIAKMNKYLLLAKNNSKLSDKAKEYLCYIWKSFFLDYPFLNYEKVVKITNSNSGKNINEFVPDSLNIHSYSFLKDFDINNPLYLYADYYPIVLQNLLHNHTLNIPPIGDTPIDDWLNDVKSIMADLIGSNAGLFYDMLTVNIYMKQFNEDIEQLSNKQIENINKYFSNKSYIDILFSKNQEIIKLHPEKQKIKVVINEKPTVPKEKLIEAILSKYKGKGIVIDFWATWCGPCLEAIELSKKIKSELKDKGIVFVYITGTSPLKEWEKKVFQIEGEHYFINEVECDYIMNYFDFSAIPTYLFYDANGKLKNKIVGYPGTERMQQMLEELLP